MNTKIELSPEQKKVIVEISKRLFASQTAHCKVETDCLEKLATSLGYASPQGGFCAILDLLGDDERGGQCVIFDSAKVWQGALIRAALRQFCDWVERDTALFRQANKLPEA